MNITATRIKRELKEKHDWQNLDNEENKWLIDPLIKDVLAIINEHVRVYKGFSIKNKRA